MISFFNNMKYYYGKMLNNCALGNKDSLEK